MAVCDSVVHSCIIPAARWQAFSLVDTQHPFQCQVNYDYHSEKKDSGRSMICNLFFLGKDIHPQGMYCKL